MGIFLIYDPSTSSKTSDQYDKNHVSPNSDRTSYTHISTESGSENQLATKSAELHPYATNPFK